MPQPAAYGWLPVLCIFYLFCCQCLLLVQPAHAISLDLFNTTLFKEEQNLSRTKQSYHSLVQYAGQHAFLKCTGNARLFDAEEAVFKRLDEVTREQPLSVRRMFPERLLSIPRCSINDSAYSCILMATDFSMAPLSDHANYLERQRRRELLTLLLQTATAVQLMHNNSMLHGDLKPFNVLVAPGTEPGQRPNVTLIDFDMAALNVTADQQVVLTGTVGFMSPESMRTGEPQTGLGRPHDIWALGATFYEALTQRWPYCWTDHAGTYGVPTTGEHCQREMQAVARGEGPPRQPIDLFKTDPPELVPVSQLVDRMLSLDPAARPTIDEVVNTLQSLQ